jgi:hypothetical protein
MPNMNISKFEPIRQRLERQPAQRMFVIGLGVGGVFGVLLLMGVGGWSGMLLCVPLLASTCRWFGEQSR